MPRIGLDQLYYAKLTEDTEEEVAYDTPVRIRNVTQLDFNPNTAAATFFADDGPRVTYSNVGEIEVAISVGEIPPKDYAELLGIPYNDGDLVYNSNAVSPDVAVGFRAQKSNGSHRYIWLFKGKFQLNEQEYQTKQDSVNFQPDTITYRSVARINDNNIFRRIDSDNDDVAENLIDDWFTDPDVEEAA